MLGSLEARTDDGVLADVPGARLRGLLIALALEPGHAVPKATLVDWIWGERPPSDAANALQRLVSRLRKALPEGLVEGRADGYRRELTGDPDHRAHRPSLGRNIMPGNPYRPTVGLHQRGQHVHRGRLARPIRAEQRKDRARTNI